MFGGFAVQPGSSPHLRKAGSRPTFSDLGTDGGNDTEEGLMYSVMGDQFKGLNMPSINASPFVPSPTFLWRFKVILFFLWGFICYKVSWDSVMRMSVDLRDLFLYEAFLYYNPLLLQWYGFGESIYGSSYRPMSTIQNFLISTRIIFTQRDIEVCYVNDYCCPFKHGSVSLSLLPWRSVIGCLSASLVDAFPLIYWEVILYMPVGMLLVFPFYIFYLSSRYFLLRTLWSIVLLFQAFSFCDFFLADILTSMSKVLSFVARRMGDHPLCDN